MQEFAATHLGYCNFDPTGPKSFEKEDVLYVSAEGHADTFYIVEMEDGQFWAAPNFNPNDDRSTEEWKKDILNQAEFIEGADGVPKLTLPDADENYHGGYFATIDEAFAATQR